MRQVKEPGQGARSMRLIIVETKALLDTMDTSGQSKFSWANPGVSGHLAFDPSTDWLRPPSVKPTYLHLRIIQGIQNLNI